MFKPPVRTSPAAPRDRMKALLTRAAPTVPLTPGVDLGGGGGTKLPRGLGD